MPIYSGGLGVLAGDHIKSASDLGIPLIAIGLFYGQGYFRQRLDQHGWHWEDYLETNVAQTPMESAIGTDGQPVTVQIETRANSIRAQVWRVKVGRVDLSWIQCGKRSEDRDRRRVYMVATAVFVSGGNCPPSGGYRALKPGPDAERASPE
jgi:starch phosphorylase